MITQSQDYYCATGLYCPNCHRVVPGNWELWNIKCPSCKTTFRHPLAPVLQWERQEGEHFIDSVKMLEVERPSPVFQAFVENLIAEMGRNLGLFHNIGGVPMLLTHFHHDKNDPGAHVQLEFTKLPLDGKPDPVRIKFLDQLKRQLASPEILEAVEAYLEGTANSIQQAAQAFDLDADMLADAIGERGFVDLCSVCGWWSRMDDLEDVGGELTCDECREDQE